MTPARRRTRHSPVSRPPRALPGRPLPSPIAWGHWNDPDYLGPGLGMTDTQAQSQFSMWAMVAAPLILGSDPRLLSTTNLNMLENPRVIAIDQDSLGAQGYLLSQSGSAQVWVRPLAGGARAVALFNTGSSSQQISTRASAVGMPRARSVQAVERLDEPDLNDERRDQRARATGRRSPLPRHGRQAHRNRLQARDREWDGEEQSGRD